MSYAAVHAYEAEAQALGVSKVARAPGGFVREYERAGSAAAMARRPLPRNVSGGRTWDQKRNGFLARMLRQYARRRTYRRYLMLIMWAYMPPLPPLRSQKSR